MHGRHVASDRPLKLQDMVAAVVGIVLVGAVVFGGLSLFSGGSSLPMGKDLNLAPVSPAEVAGITATTPPANDPPSTTPTTTTETTATTATTAVEVRPPSEVTVVVFNSVGTNGLASRVSDDLGAVGYQTLSPNDYSPLLEQSRVWFRPGFGPEAFELAALVPDALVELNPEGTPEADIVVVLGASYEE